MLPSFIIIGAQKSGTTSLYRYLASNPRTVASSIKEPNYFMRRGNFAKGIHWYEGLFRGDGDYAFEASVGYSKRHLFPGVPARMHAVLPDIKLIYLLRDPIDRVVSHYVQGYADGRKYPSFSEAIRTNRNFVETSRYYFQTQAFLEYYSREQLLLVTTEQLAQNPVDTLREIFDYLGIPPEYDSRILERRFHKSKQKKRRSHLERELLERTNNRYLRSIIKRVAKPFRKSFERPELTKSDRDFLVAEISPDTEKLRDFFKMDFPDWSL
jgi:hypothetical protein